MCRPRPIGNAARAAQFTHPMHLPERWPNERFRSNSHFPAGRPLTALIFVSAARI
jgi:hypothetical protein